MSTDGRLDLDDLGEVIDHASSLDEVSSGAEDSRPTFGERIAATGAPGWIHRHRVPLAAVTAAVVAVSAFLWVRRDTRPPDDGLPHVAVLDSPQSGLDQPTPGLVSTLYTVVRERSGDRIELLGISGPGIRATGVGAPVGISGDDSRFSIPVLATLGCQDPQALEAREDQYRLLVRRTDEYGRVLEARVPLPVGSQNRWAITVGGTCLQGMAASGITVESVRATPQASPPQVRLRLALRSRLDRDVAIDVLGYSGGQAVHPETTTAILPAGGQQVLDVDEIVADCRSPHIDGVIMSSDGQTGYGVTDRSLDAYARVVSGSQDASASSVALTWSAAEARQVAAAFATACAGLPDFTVRVASTAPAPAAAQASALQRNGDPSLRVVRTVLEVRTPATSVTVADLLTESERGGSLPTLVVIDAATGREIGTDAAPASLRTVDGTARATVDWMLSCSGAWSPPTARVALVRDGRSWPVLVPLDEPVLARAVQRACPEVNDQMLFDSGWASMRPANG